MLGCRPAAGRVARLAFILVFLGILAETASGREPPPEFEEASPDAVGDDSAGKAASSEGGSAAAEPLGDPEAEEGEPTSEEGPFDSEPEDPVDDGPSLAFDTANLETPAFPSATPYRIRDAFRLRVQSRFLPAASFDGFAADLYQPSLRFRVTTPLSQRAVLQLTARFGSSVYDFDGPTDFFGVGSSEADPFDDFFHSSLSLQGGFRINERRGLFVDEEVWSVLARGFVSSSWEGGAFGDGLTGGGSLALGYEIDDLIRVAVGINIKSRIDRSGVSIGPVLDLRWNVTDSFTLRNRGEGLQLEYALTPRFEVFVAGFFDGYKFRLDDRPGFDDDLTFRDESVQAGAGFEWKISKHLRLNLEVGAVAWRELRVRSHAMGTLSKAKSDPSAYIDIRFEVRP